MEKQRVSKSLYYYIPERYQDSVNIQITFRALSYKEMDALVALPSENRHNLFHYQVFKTAVISIENYLGDELPVSEVSPDIIKEVSDKILEVSSISSEELDKLDLTLNIALDDSLKSENWKCSVCQKKKLDMVRNCGLRGEQDKDPNFSIIVGGQVYKHCPIYDVEPKLLDDAFESYQLYDNKLLPDEGGFYDQTRFFVISSKMVEKKVREAEMKELKKNKGA